ncbi:MAG: hypothetical protein KTR27_00135 [Leptolyngbyaceae cyanobacterium MAG.088]|nr:hypothetical protein [Leptolyngbyaceae cyanobacterium MAG.088]
MSPAVLISLPFALLLLMAKGAGANASTQTQDKTKTTSGKVMGMMTEKGKFIPFPSLTNDDDMDAYSDGIVIEQYGKRYLLATSNEQG